jgi:hypothetical protein
LFDLNIIELYDQLACFPGEVHAVVLGGMPADGWLDERIRVTPATHDDPPCTVARVVFASLITHRPGSREAER